MSQTSPRNQFAAALLSYCEQRDISAGTVAKLSGIQVNTMLESDSEELSYNTMRSVWERAVAASGDPVFGLHFGESLQLAALGIVGDIIKTSPSVGAAVMAASNLIPHITDEVGVRVMHSKEQFSIILFPLQAASFSDVAKHVAECLLVFSVHELDGLVLRKIQPLKVSIPLRPRNNSEYERILRCSPTFNGHEYEIFFEASIFNTPITTGNYEAQRSLLEIVSKIGSHSGHTLSRFSAKVEDYVLRNSYFGMVTIEQVAANFNMTPRTLQRHLEKESTSFQNISDSVRKALALEYMKAGKYAVKEIAVILGYNEVSAFSRAFKRWTGQPPVAFNQ